MHLVSREFLCERLKLSRWASYKLVPATSIRLISSDDVIALLNSSRRAREDEVDFIPSDVIKAEDAEVEFGIPARKLMLWTRRSRNVAPHFRFNKQTTRFRKETLRKWIDRRLHD